MLTLSKIREEDLELLRRWRMSDHVSRYMLTDPIITSETQKLWYQQMINQSNHYHWVIQYDHKSIGYVSLTNFDARQKQYEAGHYIGEPAYLKKGISKIIEANLYDFVFDRLNLERLIFIIMRENRAAQRLHLSLGALYYKPERNVCYKNGKSYELIGQYMTKEIWQRKKNMIQYEKIMIED